MPLSRVLKSPSAELNAELQPILNAMIEGLCGVDAAGNTTFCNDALLTMTGYRAEEFIGSNLHELLHHSWPDGTKYPEEECAFRKALDGAYPIHVEGETLWRKDGTSFLAECRVLPLPRPARRTTGMVTFQDRSDLQQAQDILREGAEKFRRILASVPDVVWTSDRRGRTIYISPKAEAVFGYTKQEICASAELWMGRIHPEDFDRVRQAHIALFEQQTSFDEEYRIRRKDGEWIWVHVRALGTHLENGVHYADGVLTDITRRKQAEAELRSKSAFLEAQANSTIDGILVVDEGGRRILQNQRYAELFKIPLDMLSNKDDRQMLAYVAELIKDPQSFRARVYHLNSHPGETSRDEVEFKDGRILDRYSSPVIDAKGDYYGRIWTFRDITERRRAEEEIRESNELVRLVLDSVSEAVYGIDLQGNCTFCNPSCLRLLGYQDPADLYGKNMHALVHHSWPDGTPYNVEECHIYEAFRRGQGTHIDDEVLWHRDGTSFFAEYWSQPIHRGGDVIGTVVTFLNITERKRLEMERRLTHSSLERASDAIFWMGPQARIVYANEAACRVLGRSLQELLTLSIPDIDPLFSQEIWLAFWGNLKKRGSITFETQHQTKQGRIFPVEVTANYLEFDGQEYSFSFARDISERRETEKELRLMQFAIEHASDAIFRVDAESHIRYVNQEACRSTEHAREELLTLSIPDIGPLFPKEVWTAFWEDMKTRGATTLETVEQTKQGRVFPVEVTANYLELDGQEYLFSFVRDITERRALESQLRHAQKLEGIGQLAAGIAHEINTPTQFVSDNLTFLRDSWKSIHELLERYRSAARDAAGTLPAQVVADLEEAERSCDLEFIAAEAPRAIDQSLDGARRVAQIVRAMKEFSHPDSAEKTASDLNRAIESTITVARSEWKYVADIATDFDETLPLVVCYPGDINQVILNLVVNAAHAIHDKFKNDEKGQIKVSTRTRGEFAEIAIGDNGTGVPENIRNRIFDPFFTTKDVGKGTGQGLAFAHSVIVKKHGGKIWFETEPGRGTTFFINLPVVPARSAKEN